ARRSGRSRERSAAVGQPAGRISDRSQRSIVFKAERKDLREIVRNFSVGRENPSLGNAEAMQRFVQRGVEREIPSPKLLVDDRADLPGPGIGRKRPALVPDLIGDADTNGPLPLLGHAKARADVVADPIPAVARLKACENIKTGLEPIIP